MSEWPMDLVEKYYYGNPLTLEEKVKLQETLGTWHKQITRELEELENVNDFEKDVKEYVEENGMCQVMSPYKIRELANGVNAIFKAYQQQGKRLIKQEGTRCYEIVALSFFAYNGEFTVEPVWNELRR